MLKMNSPRVAFTSLRRFVAGPFFWMWLAFTTLLLLAFDADMAFAFGIYGAAFVMFMLLAFFGPEI